MNKTTRNLILVFSVFILILVGLFLPTWLQTKEIAKLEEVSLTAHPVSVNVAGGTHGKTVLSIVIETEEVEQLLCRAEGGDLGLYYEAAACVEYEINSRGKNAKIDLRLRETEEPNKFTILNVSVWGLHTFSIGS